MPNKEPNVIINGCELQKGDAMTLVMAIEVFVKILNNEESGDKILRENYLHRCARIQPLLQGDNANDNDFEG